MNLKDLIKDATIMSKRGYVSLDDISADKEKADQRNAVLKNLPRFLRFQENVPVVVHVISNPFQYLTHWIKTEKGTMRRTMCKENCVICANLGTLNPILTGPSPKPIRRFAMWAIEKNEVVVMEVGKMLAGRMADVINQTGKTGTTIEDLEITIIKTETGGKFPQYIVTGKKQKLDKDILEGAKLRVDENLLRVLVGDREESIPYIDEYLEEQRILNKSW